MEIQVHLPGLLRDSAGGRSELTVRGVTLGEAVGDLLERYPLLRLHLYDEDGKLRQHVLLYYNSESVGRNGPLDAPLRPGDQLDIVQAVSGG